MPTRRRTAASRRRRSPKLAEKPAEGEPLLAELKKDPWDGDYVLQLQGETFTVVSFAEDKKEGGEGAATDVRSDQFPREDEFKRTSDEWTGYDKKVEATARRRPTSSSSASDRVLRDRTPGPVHEAEADPQGPRQGQGAGGARRPERAWPGSAEGTGQVRPAAAGAAQA